MAIPGGLWLPGDSYALAYTDTGWEPVRPVICEECHSVAVESPCSDCVPFDTGPYEVKCSQCGRSAGVRRPGLEACSLRCARKINRVKRLIREST